MKYIDADKLIAEILALKEKYGPYVAKNEVERCYKGGRLIGFEDALNIIKKLQQEQPIKVYRVENEKEQKGLWRKFDGTWEPLFDMLTDGQCRDLPMDDSPIYRDGGKRWFASAPSKETLQKWFSQKDLEELTAVGFTITEFEVLEYRKLSDFEYIFTRESIVNKTNINVTDIYPKEQPVERLGVTDFCKPIDPGIAQCVADHWWELLDDENAADEKVVKELSEKVSSEITRQVKDTLAKQPVEGLEEEIDACWQNWLSPSNQKEVEGVLPKTEFATYARHFAEWGAEHLKNENL